MIVLLLSFVAGSSGSPQEPIAATSVRGQVVDERGQPVDGAVVIAVPWPAHADDDPALVQATTVAGGFELPLSARGVSLWAAAAGRASAVAEHAAGMSAPVLTVQPVAHGDFTVRGLTAWLADGVLRARVVVPAAAPTLLPVVLGASGVVTLPACPPGELWLDLIDARDALLTRLPLERGERVGDVVVPAPVTVRLRVQDRLGDPLSGARVRHQAAAALPALTHPFPTMAAPVWRDVGVADADGRLSVRLPLACDPASHPDDPRLDCQFVVVAEGHAPAWAGISGGVFVDGHSAALADGELVIAVAEDEPLRVRVLAAGKPFADRRVWLSARSTSMEGGGGGFSFRTAEWRAAARTDGDGMATFDGVPRDAGELRLHADLRADEALAAFVPVPTAGNPEVDLAAAAMVEVRVTDAEGRAVAGVRGLAMAAPPRILTLDPWGPEPTFVSDAKGGARLRLAHGTWWMWLLDGERYAHACVEVEPGHDGDPIVALVLQPLATWTAQVRHADGRPAAGARMRLPGSEWKDGVPIPPAEQLQPLQFLGDFDRRLVQTAMVDRHGRLQMRFTPPLVGYTFGRLMVGTAGSDETRLDPERLPANVTVR